MITPMDIQNKAFNKGVRGYREEEVDSFLDLITLDMEKLIEIGLSYIPKSCAMAGAIRYVQELVKDPSLDWKTARKKLLQKYTSSFGMRKCRYNPVRNG